MNRLLAKEAKLKESFVRLTPAKQREYAAYINEAKKIETRQKRLDKIAPMILKGIGINVKYIKKK